jgi:hypothetical protein
LRAHDRQHGASDIQRTEQVDLDLSLELLGADLLEKPRLKVRRVVDEYVDAAEPIDRGLHCRFGIRAARDV